MSSSSLRLIAGLFGASLLALSPQAHAQTTVVVPPSDSSDGSSVVYTRANTPAVVSGALMFGVAYGAVVIVAATTDRDANNRLYVPLIGPWLAIKGRGDCPVDQEACDSETTKKILLGADGVFQAAGVITLAYGLLTTRSYRHGSASHQGVEIVPVAMQGGGRGFGLAGTF
jgi:hypothetical protein